MVTCRLFDKTQIGHSGLIYLVVCAQKYVSVREFNEKKLIEKLSVQYIHVDDIIHKLFSSSSVETSHMPNKSTNI